MDHDLIDTALYLPEPSGARQTTRQGGPKGECGGANQNLFYSTTAPGIILFLNRVKPKTRQGQVFLVNASQIVEKGDPKNFIPEAGIQRIADTESYRPVGEIVAEIEHSRTHADHLLQAVLKEAFAPTQ